MRHIYFARSPKTGLVKIGQTGHLEARIKSLGCRLVGVIPTKKMFVEADIHRFFEDDRKQGEWFDLDDHRIHGIIELWSLDHSEIKRTNHLVFSEMGKKGGAARAKALSPERRSEIARLAGSQKGKNHGKSK